MKTVSVITTVALMLISSIALADVPPMINYQGKLLQPSGAPVADGTYSLGFAIHNIATGGTALWSETNPSVQVKGGLFAVMLGSVVNIPSSVFNNTSLFFGIKVGSDPEMTPRQQIASSAFAFRSSVAGTVDDSAITTTKIAAGSITPEKLSRRVTSVSGQDTSLPTMNNLADLATVTITPTQSEVITVIASPAYQDNVEQPFMVHARIEVDGQLVTHSDYAFAAAGYSDQRVLTAVLTVGAGSHVIKLRSGKYSPNVMGSYNTQMTVTEG